MKLSRITLIASAILIVLVTGVLVFSFSRLAEAEASIQSNFDESIETTKLTRDLDEVLRNLQLDVVQTQQWLTDISATRGLDGLNDGFDIAATYAERLPSDISRARELAAILDLPDLLGTLDVVEAGYGPYYASGIALAQSFVQGGPALGNQNMPAFDAEAEKLGNAIEAMLLSATAGINQHLTHLAMENSKAEAQIVEANLLLGATAALIVLAFVAMTGFFVFFVLRRFGQLAKSMRSLADGQLDVDLGSNQKWQELSQMAETIAVFRENAVRVRDMTEEEKATLARTSAERARMMQELQETFGDVVHTAVKGDFSRRIDKVFADEELNGIAKQVNDLVETVDRGLRETGSVLGALANTDLSRRVEGNYEGAFLQLKNDTNAVGEKLVEIVGQLRDTSGALKTATGEILAGANDLSERTTKQAATVEETSATMEQLSGTVMASAGQADDASAKSQTLAHTAEETGGVVNKATDAMSRITSSSAKISNVIGMIDDIAFQTNLLALNASVEAARAGEAGKGFAVVAVEVRRLAQSAAEASSEVKVLIEQSASEVEQGSKFVTVAAEKLQNMIEGIQENSGLMQGIAKASREQASSIEEVNAAVRQMDEMTQHNAALVEETNAAIEQTDNQVVELDRIVDVFKLGGQSAATSSPAQKSAPAVKGDARALQGQAKQAAKSYLSEGSAAIDSEWAEF